MSKTNAENARDNLIESEREYKESKKIIKPKAEEILEKIRDHHRGEEETPDEYYAKQHNDWKIDKVLRDTKGMRNTEYVKTNEEFNFDKYLRGLLTVLSSYTTSELVEASLIVGSRVDTNDTELPKDYDAEMSIKCNLSKHYELVYKYLLEQ